jgi:hypothetical protein
MTRAVVVCGPTTRLERFAGLRSVPSMLRKRDGSLVIAAVGGASRADAAKIGGMDRQRLPTG